MKKHEVKIIFVLFLAFLAIVDVSGCYSEDNIDEVIELMGHADAHIVHELRGSTVKLEDKLEDDHGTDDGHKLHETVDKLKDHGADDEHKLHKTVVKLKDYGADGKQELKETAVNEKNHGTDDKQELEETAVDKKDHGTDGGQELEETAVNEKDHGTDGGQELEETAVNEKDHGTDGGQELEETAVNEKDHGTDGGQELEETAVNEKDHGTDGGQELEETAVNEKDHGTDGGQELEDSATLEEKNKASFDLADYKSKFQKALLFAEVKDWQKATILLKELHLVLPNNRQITNNLAVIYFYQGRIDRAQQLWAEICESSKETRIAFKNIQMLYGYVAAEAYRQGLGKNQKSKVPAFVINRSIDNGLENDWPAKSQLIVARSPAAAYSKEETPAEIASVKERLLQWADAWSDGDVDLFISFYMPDYSPRKLSRESWIEDRKRKINPLKMINVELDIKDIYMKPYSEEIFSIFVQNYQSSNYQDVSKKKITWVKLGDEWLIKEEIVDQ